MASSINIPEPAPAETAPAARASPPRRIGHGRGGDTLGIAWLNDSLQCVAFRRQQPLKSWVSPKPVESIAAFALALDEALAALDFGGTETFLILAHDQFVHQSETAPGFSDGSARSYLRGLMERYEKTNGRMLWVSQRAAAVRNDAMYLVHRLPATLYHEINAVLLARRLDLGRILPVVVPLQQSLAALDEARDVPVLVMAPAGRSTVLIVARPGGELLFSRTILESWQNDPDRVAVEVNRSLLYARQQFASAVTKIHLFGDDTPAVEASIVAKCGQDVKISASNVDSKHWLADMAKLPARHPVNLVAGHLRRKRQVRFVRRVLLAACWVGLIFLGVDLWTHEQNRVADSLALTTLAQSEDELRAEYERLTERNAVADGRREMIRAIADEAMPPVAGKFLAYFATVLPAEGRLSEFSVRWDDSARQWIFRIDGVIEADSETARSMIATMRRELTQCPLRIRLAEAAREPVALVAHRGAMASQYQFALEGGLFAN